MEETKGKKSMTEEERLKLAEKLDKELDEYISNLEKRPYTEGWPEDRWQEEMQKHPFFMTKPPDENEPLSPLMEGLQQLKYDETENSPEDLAATYKEDGNFHFKIKKYRVAVLSYTEGLRHKCSDDSLNAQLYNNRAAAHFLLKNYRSCLNDCKSALNLQPQYIKAQKRAAHCHYLLGEYDDCISLCTEIICNSSGDKEFINLKLKAMKDKNLCSRDNRKEHFVSVKLNDEEEKLIQTIKHRGISLKSNKLPTRTSDPRVHLENDHLMWPVVFLYPEYETSDFIEEFNEDSTFQEHIDHMFSTCPDWDLQKKYHPDNLALYWQEDSTGVLRHVNTDSTLREVLCDNGFVVVNGTPSFVVTYRGKDHMEIVRAAFNI